MVLGVRQWFILRYTRRIRFLNSCLYLIVLPTKSHHILNIIKMFIERKNAKVTLMLYSLAHQIGLVTMVTFVDTEWYRGVPGNRPRINGGQIHIPYQQIHVYTCRYIIIGPIARTTPSEVITNGNNNYKTKT